MAPQREDETMLEITERRNGITVWYSTQAERYGASRDRDGIPFEPAECTHETPELAVQVLLEDEQASRED